MRFYRIVITDPTTGKVLQSPASAETTSTYTSFVNGQTIPGALNVELDIPTMFYANPIGAAYVRVWGIPIAEISQAANLNGKTIAIYAGMQKGLPLANPALAGLIVTAQIFQAFGNWVDTAMTLDMILQPNAGSPSVVPPSDPLFIPLIWKAGTPLSAAIGQALSVAFPGVKQSISINPNLVLPYDQPGVYDSLNQFAAYIKQKTAAMAPTPNYPGVDIYYDGTTLKVTDGTTAPPTKQVLFQDLIGQPTWIDAPNIQFKCPIRADIKTGDVVKLPQTLVTVTSASASSLLNQKVTFQGTFTVSQIRHVGNFRQPDAAAWATTFDAFPNVLA